jgi:hypothetical protein
VQPVSRLRRDDDGGLDGVKNKLDPGAAMDKDLYDLPKAELKNIPTVCGSLRQALEELDKDRAFLKAGGVFDDDFIDSYIELKMTEVIRFEHTPHPSNTRCIIRLMGADSTIEERGAPGGAPFCASCNFRTVVSCSCVATAARSTRAPCSMSFLAGGSSRREGH